MYNFIFDFRLSTNTNVYLRKCGEKKLISLSRRGDHAKYKDLYFRVEN